MNTISNERKNRVKWFEAARFGMFIHWGAYATAGRNEWVRFYEKLSIEDYKTYVDRFNPTEFNAQEWAETAHSAGMKYAVLTAKHHDGYCLFDSKLTNYKTKRDYVHEYVDAFRAEGLKVGLYYSLLDWQHGDYPHFGDENDPMRDNIAFKDKKQDFNRYLDYIHGQVKELMTNYGTIDVLWFDFSYADMVGEKWRATELVKMVRSYQPNIIINNRLEVSGQGRGSLLTGKPSIYGGDFFSPEQIMPPYPIVDDLGEPVTWEVCTTINNSWGYVESDKNYKEPSFIIKKLIECVSKGGNMMLNVAPNGKGKIDPEIVSRLFEVGKWLEKNGESIYGCGNASIPRTEFGRYTKNGDYVFLHIHEFTLGPMPLIGIKKGSLEYAEHLATGSEVLISTSWIQNNFSEYTFVCPHQLDSTSTVLKLKIKEKGFA